MSNPPDDHKIEEVANQPDVKAASQQLRDSGVATFQDFITDYGPDQTPNMEAAQQQVDRIAPNQQLRNLDVKLDQPEHDNEPDR